MDIHTAESLVLESSLAEVDIATRKVKWYKAPSATTVRQPFP